MTENLTTRAKEIISSNLSTSPLPVAQLSFSLGIHLSMLSTTINSTSFGDPGKMPNIPRTSAVTPKSSSSFTTPPGH